MSSKTEGSTRKYMEISNSNNKVNKIALIFLLKRKSISKDKAPRQ